MSSSSVAAALAAGAAEAIPKEYHRRVLKKIAQLTKVIYALNTKNEDHEVFVESLRRQYEERAKQAEGSSARRLGEMEERVRGACEDTERRVQELRSKLGKEKEQLKQSHESYKREVDGRLRALQEEHGQAVEGLVHQVERVRSEQAGQLQEVVQLREGVRRKVEERERELAASHKKEMVEAEQQWREEVSKWRSEATLLKTAKEREAKSQGERHRAELESLRLTLRREHEEAVAAERKAWEEKLRSLQEELRGREGGLAHQVSSLSGELRTARDQVTVAQQRIVEMERELEVGKSDSAGLRAQLKEMELERGRLRAEVERLQGAMAGAEEEGKKWTENLTAKEAAIARLEADHSASIRALQSELLSLQERLRDGERERESLATQHKSSSEQHSDRVRALEKEVGRLQQEKQALHSQYAQEIEAAHAEIGAREAELGTQHMSTLEDMRQQHSRVLQEAQQEKSHSLEQLRRELMLAAEQERQSLDSKHREEVELLRREVGEKETQLARTVSELSKAQNRAEEKGRGLGKVEGEVGRLKEVVERLREEERTLREKESLARREAEKMKVTLEEGRKEREECAERHKKELRELRSTTHQAAEREWQEKLRNELESLRRDLTEAHSCSLREALARLGQQRDSAMREARDAWDRERERLREKMMSLENQLLKLQQASSLSLEEGRREAEQQIAALREMVECERRSHEEEVEQMRRLHGEEVGRVRGEVEERWREEVEGVREEHRVEMEAREEAHRVAVRVVKESGERETREEVRRAAARHQQEIASLRTELSEQHQAGVERLEQGWREEREGWSREREQLASQRETEVSAHLSQLEEVRAVLERRERELCLLRESTNTKTVEIGQLRKHLEVRGQELDVARREASTILRCREQELNSAHQSELESLASQHRQATQLLMNDFNTAKKMMTNQVAQLQRQLIELESRYRNRDPRPEDVETIRELQRVVQGQEVRMKEMAAEKRIYQLELVNREKNYNQIFSASPHVGVLDPFSGKKKPKSLEVSLATRHSSAPSLTSEQTKLPALVDSTVRLTSSDIELARQIRDGRPRSRQQPLPESPLSRRRFRSKDTEH